jgi:hypothetical protein
MKEVCIFFYFYKNPMKELMNLFVFSLLLIVSISYDHLCPRFVPSDIIRGLGQGSGRLRHQQCPNALTGALQLGWNPVMTYR